MNCKLDDNTARLIRESKQSNRALARLTGVSHETIRLCRAQITWGDKRARYIQRIKEREREHKGVKDLQARLIDATAKQLDVENKIERKTRAA